MADIGEQFITYLKTVSGVTSLVGSGTSARILQQEGMKESGTRPAVCFTITDDQAITYQGGSSALRRADLALTGFADSTSSRNSLAAALEAALPRDSSVTAFGSLPVTEITQLMGRSDAEELARDGSDQRIYVTQTAWRVWYYGS